MSTAPAAAHPLGNFTVSHYTRLEVRRNTVELRYVVDMAEIPTFQEIQETGVVADTTHPTVARYLPRKAEMLKDGLALVVHGHRLPLEVVGKTIIFPPGAGGLPTLKVAVRYRAKLAGGETKLDIRYRDDNFSGRAGWKEIVAVVDTGLELVESSVPAEDRSRELSDYPTDLLDSPPQTVTASLVVKRPDPPSTETSTYRPPAARTPRLDLPPPLAHASGSDRAAATPSDRDVPTVRSDGDAGAPLTPNRRSTPRSSFTDLIATPRLGAGIIVFALIAAGGLGAFHALEPGHGKTLVAAYLVGSRGTAWHALALGLVVTAAHTAGVYLLGAVTLYASRYVLPERLYPWLGVSSGLLIAGLGVALFVRRYAGDALENTHHHAHPHHHHHHAPGAVSLRTLFALGITGGIVPCPAALVVLLSAISLNRVAFGLVLIVAFSVGLAAVLIAIGLLIVYARRLMTRFHGEGAILTRWLPLTSSAVMTVLGAAIVIQSLRAAGVLAIGPL
jgi:ABC-type nickel/cobalt efflux system permease component RcnA